ncbi:MAG TPA: hypothetical protein VG456_11475 [Candidatus Sulfopaludibacter sp.]|nr:hypothetical protein [Candidatus Sulfopaludibacter sp.]
MNRRSSLTGNNMPAEAGADGDLASAVIVVTAWDRHNTNPTAPSKATEQTAITGPLSQALRRGACSSVGVSTGLIANSGGASTGNDTSTGGNLGSDHWNSPL